MKLLSKSVCPNQTQRVKHLSIHQFSSASSGTGSRGQQPEKGQEGSVPSGTCLKYLPREVSDTDARTTSVGCSRCGGAAALLWAFSKGSTSPPYEGNSFCPLVSEMFFRSWTRGGWDPAWVLQVPECCRQGSTLTFCIGALVCHFFRCTNTKFRCTQIFHCITLNAIRSQFNNF